MSDGEKMTSGDISSPHLQPWEVLSEKELFDASPWIQLSVQEVRLPDGRSVDDYHQIALSEYAVIFAQTADERVIVERQYKHGIGKVSLTLPAGMIEKGEDPQQAAERELLEETGYAAEQWRSLGSYVVSANYGCGRAHLFVARNARSVAEPNSGDLEQMEISLMTLDGLTTAVSNGEVSALGTIAAIGMATNPLWIASRE